jgi:AcrR family transcriptional regulator
MFATAELVEEEGYTALTIAAIIKRAGVSHRAFNGLFADKQAAFMAILELGFQRTMAVTARAFAAGASWPERIWEAARASTNFLRLNPTIAHTGTVAGHTAGPDAVARADAGMSAFTIFLQEGLRLRPQAARSASPLAQRAIATTVYELFYHESRHAGSRSLAGLVPHIAFLCLAPFLGPAETNRFIDEQLAAGA